MEIEIGTEREIVEEKERERERERRGGVGESSWFPVFSVKV